MRILLQQAIDDMRHYDNQIIEERRQRTLANMPDHIPGLGITAGGGGSADTAGRGFDGMPSTPLADQMRNALASPPKPTVPAQPQGRRILLPEN